MSELIYGVLVKEAEFFTEEAGKEERCGCKAVTQPRNPGSFCAFCGVRFRTAPKYVPTALCQRFFEHFKTTAGPAGWRDSAYGDSRYLQSSRWFHQRTNKYGNVDDQALVGQHLPMDYEQTAQWRHEGALYFFRPEAFQQDIIDDPEDPHYYDAKGDPVDDSMARFLKSTRDELEKLGLLEGRLLRVYLW